MIVGIEPTGHYWLNLAHFLEEKGIPLVMVNPMHVKRSKELGDNLPTKHDAKDALVIARLVKDGRFSYPRILEVEAELRAGSTFRESLVKERNAVHNQMIRWLDQYFPEFVQVFPSFGNLVLAVLENTPFPMDIVDQTVEGIMERYRQSEGLKCPQKPKIQKLIEVSRDSIGITEGQRMARIQIATLVRRYRQLEQEIATLTEELVALAQTTVEYEWLQTIPGLGDATIVE